MREIFGYGLGSTLVLFGAFAIGGVLHQSLVENKYPVTSPFAVFGMLAGVALVAVGYRVEQRYSGAVEDEEEDEEEFDEEHSPISEEDLEKYERDEDYDGSNRRG